MSYLFKGKVAKNYVTSQRWCWHLTPATLKANSEASTNSKPTWVT